MKEVPLSYAPFYRRELRFQLNSGSTTKVCFCDLAQARVWQFVYLGGCVSLIFRTSNGGSQGNGWTRTGWDSTQARRESFLATIKSLRIHRDPRTMLLDPEGKIISLSQTRNGQPSLRGEDLLKSLDKLLPR